MLEAKEYTFGELVEIIKESPDRTNIVVGKNVWKDNSQNNVKAVKDIMKQTDEYNDVKEKERSDNPKNKEDYNKTTLDVNFSYEPSDDYKKRVKSQVHGFPSVQNEKESKIKDENDSLDFEGNEKFYKNDKKNREDILNKKAEIKHAGLKSHNLSKDNFKDKNIFTNENKKMKRLTYNKAFLNEEHVIKKIPDDYKKDGNKFIMRDVNGVEYIVECKKDTNIDYIHTNIVQVINRNALNEQFKRMKELTEYDSSRYNAVSTSESRKRENDIISENLEKAKNLLNKKEHTK